jgi:putative effector of murein hydrolase
MNNPELMRSFIAGGAIVGNTIVKFSSDDNTVIPASAATDLCLGVADAIGQVTTGARIDVVMDGIYEIVAGGTITRGSKVTSDASGYAVAAAPAAGVNNQVIGIALKSAVSGDIFPVLIEQSVMQG